MFSDYSKTKTTSSSVFKLMYFSLVKFSNFLKLDKNKLALNLKSENQISQTVGA